MRLQKKSFCIQKFLQIDSAHMLAMIMHMSNLHLLLSFLLDVFFLFREGIVLANPGGARLVYGRRAQTTKKVMCSVSAE